MGLHACYCCYVVIVIVGIVVIVVIVIVMVLPCLPALACLPARLPACLPVNLIRSHFGRSSNASANTGAKTSTNASAKQRIRSHGKLLLPLQTHFGHFESSRGFGGRAVAGGAGTAGAVSFDLRGRRSNSGHQEKLGPRCPMEKARLNLTPLCVQASGRVRGSPSVAAGSEGEGGEW